MDNTMTVTINGTTYSIVAVEFEDNQFSPDIAVIDANGEPIRKIVDSETTDEQYTNVRDCLLMAMAHIV